MSTTQIGLAIASVLLIAVGQLLFKAVGVASAAAGTLMHPRALLLVCVAGALYVAATLAWIWLLRTAPLSRAYPYMALSFVLVPLLSAFFFRESLSAQYVIGIVLVIAGIVVATLDSSA